VYYRRKILLSILEQFGGEVSRTGLQKLLFVFTRWQEGKKSFDFVPYLCGCYSFQANQDLKTLTKLEYIEQDKEGTKSPWKIKGNGKFRETLKKNDKIILMRLYNKFKDASQDDLIRYTYENYPFYAINSKIAYKYLNEIQLERVDKQKRTFAEKTLFTIGYEGITLEKYLQKLIIQDVKLLCDVRKNSFSMKYGFSKSQLKQACEQLGIVFTHIPELGIESNKRKELKTQKDYDLLFDEYEQTTLVENHDFLLKLSGLFDDYNRIAITCFEAHVCMCHRGRVAEALKKLPSWSIPIKHL